MFELKAIEVLPFQDGGLAHLAMFYGDPSEVYTVSERSIRFAWVPRAGMVLLRGDDFILSAVGVDSHESIVRFRISYSDLDLFFTVSVGSSLYLLESRQLRVKPHSYARRLSWGQQLFARREHRRLARLSMAAVSAGAETTMWF